MLFVCDLLWVQAMHLLPGEVLCWWLLALSWFVNSSSALVWYRAHERDGLTDCTPLLTFYHL